MYRFKFGKWVVASGGFWWRSCPFLLHFSQRWGRVWKESHHCVLFGKRVDFCGEWVFVPSGYRVYCVLRVWQTHSPQSSDHCSCVPIFPHHWVRPLEESPHSKRPVHRAHRGKGVRKKVMENRRDKIESLTVIHFPTLSIYYIQLEIIF